MVNGKGPIAISGKTLASAGKAQRGLSEFTSAHYVRTSSGLYVSKYFSGTVESPLDHSIFIPRLVIGRSLDDIELGTLPVEREDDQLFIGIKNNLYFPEHNLYVINTDNLTYYALAEAARRGDIALGASLFTCDAHMDIMPPVRKSALTSGQDIAFPPPLWERGTLQDFAEYAKNINPLQQLQAAIKTGLIKEQEIHLISPFLEASSATEQPLVFPGSPEPLGRIYLYPRFPSSHFNSLPKEKIVAHVDIDFHSEESEGLEALQKSLKDPAASPAEVIKALETILSGVEPKKVMPQNVDKFKLWARENGYFRKAGLRIICVSPNIVLSEDVLWLTREHVKLVMEES